MVSLQLFPVEAGTTAGPEVPDQPPQVAAKVRAGEREGLLTLTRKFISGSAAASTAVAPETGAVQDFKDSRAPLFPGNPDHGQECRRDHGNLYAQVRGAFRKPSMSLPANYHRLPWGARLQTEFLGFDDRPRVREIRGRHPGFPTAGR